MKKILGFVLGLFVCISLNAQVSETDTLKNETMSVDSLYTSLKTVQHDYNFLWCDYQLFKVYNDLIELSTSLDIKSNSLEIDYYNGRFSYELYEAYSDNYDASLRLFNKIKENIESTQNAVLLRIIATDFSEQELNVLKSRFVTIQAANTKVEGSLNLYSVALKGYRNKR